MILHVDLRLENCEAEVYLNDIPVLKLAAGSPRLATRPVGEFVVGGENILEVVAFPGPTPSRARQRDARPTQVDGRVEAALMLYAEGDFPGSGAGRRLAGIDHDIVAGSPPPRRLAASARFGAAHGEWAWQQARALALDRDTLLRLGRMTAAAHAAFAARNAEFFLQHGLSYFQEMALAYPGIPVDRRIERFRASFVPRAGDPPWQVAPLDPATFDFRLCAGGRLVELTGADWQPLIRSLSVHYPLPLFVGEFAGQLLMLR